MVQELRAENVASHGTRCETLFPALWCPNAFSLNRFLQVFRPDLFIGTARALVSHVFSEEFMGLASKDDLKGVTKGEILILFFV